MPIDQIKNFLSLGPQLATAGQPTEAQLEEIAAAGYEVVVNLGLLDPRYCLADEAGLVARLGMAYHHIPVKFDEPQLADFERFTSLMSAISTRRVFGHCAANWRVCTFVALDRQLRVGWSSEMADAHAKTFWEPNETWLSFMTHCREKLLLGD